jgi:hypothetical protein
MIAWLEQKIAAARIRAAQAKLDRMVNILANSREVRAYRANRSAQIRSRRDRGAA